MQLAAGTRVGGYEVTALIGAGGMGEVYRARDARLNRDVALKVLPAHLALDPDRLGRFKREAQVLASLNHPHIAAIHGLEESGSTLALVLELVEGPTLADRIAQGPIPVEEALPLARQISEALEAAHERGVIHRDLKPSNIKVRPDGTVKVLDFGLAKALEPEAFGVDVSNSPTLTSPAATRLGVVMGTAAYMSPEQARGKAVDKRTDIWAFGCVLYEMLAGKRAFGSDDVTDTLAAIVRGEPDWMALPADMPPAIGMLLRRALVKDRRDRLPDIGVARLEINDVRAAPPAVVPSGSNRSRWAAVLAAATAAGIVVGAVATGVWYRQERVSSPAEVSSPLTRTTIDLPANAPLALGTGIPEVGFDSPALALSPDGRRLAYVGQSASGTVVYVREMASFVVRVLQGTEGAIYAFFSPDGRTVGFLTNDKVKKVSLDGGSPVTLCDALQPVSATWVRDDIYFSENQGWSLSRIAAVGGRPNVVVPGVLGVGPRFNQVLPDGRSALVTFVTRGISHDYADIGVVSLPGGEHKEVLIQSGYDGRYVASGHLLFGRGGSLFAIRFDPTRLEVLGDAVEVVAGASMESLFGQVHTGVSNNGVIAYVPGGERAIGRLAWVDRQGQTEYLPTPTRLYGVLDLTADGARVAVHVADVTDYIWVYDFVRGEGRRVTVGEHSGWPVWSPDNRTIAFAAWQSYDQRRLLSRTADGSGPVKELLPAASDRSATPYSWSPDGRVLALAGRGGGFYAVEDTPKLVGDAFGFMPHFSPDGRWVAYVSAERPEIFVRSYPDGKIVRQFSTDGGIEPVWCGCGELFYRKGNRWMSSAVRTEPELRWAPPKVAFQTDFIDTSGRSYDVSADGKRLLVIKQAQPDVRSQINVVANWLEQLNQRETGERR